jgi:hypothetical protein
LEKGRLRLLKIGESPGADANEAFNLNIYTSNSQTLLALTKVARPGWRLQEAR